MKQIESMAFSAFVFICSIWMIVLAVVICVNVAKIAKQPVGRYQVDETLNYAAWYFVDTLQDDLRNQFQR